MSTARIAGPVAAASDVGVAERIPSLPFIWWAIGLALTGGFAQGLVLFLLPAAGRPIGLWWVAAAQAHGHVQMIGWAGMFAQGVGLYFLPRLRGCPPPSARAVRAAARLLGVGLTLRAISQPLVAAAEPGGFRVLAAAGLVLSGPLELAGAVLAVGALALSARAGPPLRTRVGLLAVLPFAFAFFAALIVGLSANVALGAAAAAAGTGLIPGVADRSAVHLGLVGMLVPISAAISARTFPLYLRLRVPPRGELHAVFGVFLVGFVLRALTPFELPEYAKGLPPLGALLEGVAILGLVAVLDVPLRRTRRVPPGREAPPRAEDRAAEWLILSAYLWLAAGGLLLLADGLAAWELVPRPPADAERHVLGAGFISLLILGMAVRLLPGFAGRRLHSAGLVWASFWLGNAAALLRAVPLFLPSSRLTVGLLALAGLLGLLAVACLGWNLRQTLRKPVAVR